MSVSLCWSLRAQPGDPLSQSWQCPQHPKQQALGTLRQGPGSQTGPQAIGIWTLPPGSLAPEACLQQGPGGGLREARLSP